MDRSQFIHQLNLWGKLRLPFFFLIDFEMEKPQAWQMHELDPAEVMFDFEGLTNASAKGSSDVLLQKLPPPFEEYLPKFRHVHEQLQLGNTFLLNLTARTRIVLSGGLDDVFYSTKAKYRLRYRNDWVVFSPETFIRISGNRMETCPMKGTIDAGIPDAAKILLSDPKELAEHVTVVDLLRNDMSRFCSDVRVEQFRFTETIESREKKLIQTSSRISGQLAKDFHGSIGDMLMGMLPAGSVSGAPKAKTCQIISEAEKEKRGYYTGVAGVFDGENLNSCVLIRFIERDGESYFYRSGGGITAQSIASQEYQELIDKVYVPSARVHQSIS